jgi:phosphoesterase RecJ-like protein
VFESTGSTAEDTEGLVDYARSIDGVDIGVLIEERPDGSVKASLRAKDAAYRLDLIAAQFNGGGHACAAGLNLKSDTGNFYARLVAALARQLEVVDRQGKAAP